jgi:hypothetical protein
MLGKIDAATAKRDNERIATFDNSIAWISYIPRARECHLATASCACTFEYDWTRDDAPCISSAVRY